MASGFLARGGAWVVAQAVLLAISLVGPIYWRSSHFFAWPVHVAVGGVLILTGFAFATAGALALGTSLTPLPHPKEGSQLKTDGIYRLVRHPIYSGVIFLVIGYTVLFPSLPESLTAVIVLLFFDRKASREERWLRARYPDYDDFAKHSRKLFPWIY